MLTYLAYAIVLTKQNFTKMKTFKKIWLGIAALVVFLPPLLVFIPTAAAAGNCGNQSVCLDQSYWDGATYSMPSQDIINVSNGPNRVQFQKAVGNTYDTSPLGGNPPNGLCGTYNENSITLNSPDFSKATLSGNLSVLYSLTTTNQQGQNQTNCSNSYKKSGLSITNLAVNQGGSCTYAACSNNDIKGSLSSFKLAADAGSITGTFNGKTVTFTDGDTSDTNHTYSAPIGKFCSGGGQLGSVTIADGDFQKILSNKENPVPGVVDVDWYNATDKSCNNYSPGNTAPININTAAYIAAVSPGAPCSPPGTTQGNLICGGSDGSACTTQGCVWAAAPNNPNSANGATSCESNFDSTFAWVICPALNLADQAAGTFNNFIETQLCFSTGSISSTGSGITCQGNNNLNSGVEKAWSVFKNIATILLVLVMLVMVISQAFGGGPFEAYTIRKMLPKLVAAVIIMQLSWVLIKFAIDLSNDIGVGIRDLMFAPFGGGDKLQLDHLVGTNLGTHTTGQNDTFAFLTVIAAGTAAFIVSVPTLALLGLYIVLGLLTAFIVLIFRKLLIILLVIAAPLAIIAWILPGTENYWKLWSRNFMKLLAMFPLIMALIAAGRIFAGITSGNIANGVISMPHLAVVHLGPLPVPYLASVSSFVDLAIIIIAYFGPYFLLPQTYKWGGEALGAIGKGVPKALESVGGKQAKEYLQWRQGLSPWKQARAARRAKQEILAKTGFYEGLGAGGLTGQVRRARLRSFFRPTPGGLRGERALTGSIVRGGAQRAEEEALKEAGAALEHELATDPSAIADHDAYVIDIARAGVGATVHGRARSEADWRAAVEKMFQYGGPNNRVFLELNAEYRARGGEDRARWEKIMNALAPTALQKFPFLYKDPDYADRDPATHALHDLRTTITQFTPESFTKAGVEGEAVETILGHLSTIYREGAAPGASAEQRALGTQAQELSTTMYSLFSQTVTNEATRGNVNPAAARAMMAAAGAISANPINAGRGAPGLPTIDAGAMQHAITTSGDPDMPQAISNMLANIRPDGTPR